MITIMSDIEIELKIVKQQLASSKREGDKEMTQILKERIIDIKSRLEGRLQMYEQELKVYTLTTNTDVVAHIKGRISKSKTLIAAAS